MYIRWLIFSCDLLSLYPAVHFLSSWLSGIMAIMNSDYEQWLWIIIIIHSLELFTSALADGFSLESEWHQVSSSLQDSSQYSGGSQ